MKAYGEGTVRQLRSGNWQARMPDLTPLGTYPTEAQAWKALRRAITEREDGNWTDPRKGKMPLKAYAEQLLPTRKLSVGTRDWYERMLRVHIYPTLGTRTLTQLAANPALIDKWYADLAAKAEADDDDTGRTVPAAAYKTLRMVLGHAVRQRYIKANPCTTPEVTDAETPERQPLEVDQFYVLLDAVPERFRAMVFIAAMRGLRFGELAGLRRCDFDPLHHELVVMGIVEDVSGKPLRWRPFTKTGDQRHVPLDETMEQTLLVHLGVYVGAEPDALLFTGDRGGALRRSSWGRIWRPACAKVGLAGVHLHDLRHTCGTWLAETGAHWRDIMALLGHKDQAMAKLYVHSRDTRRAEQAAALTAYVESQRGATANVAALRRSTKPELGANLARRPLSTGAKKKGQVL